MRLGFFSFFFLCQRLYQPLTGRPVDRSKHSRENDRVWEVFMKQGRTETRTRDSKDTDTHERTAHTPKHEMMECDAPSVAASIR